MRARIVDVFYSIRDFNKVAKFFSITQEGLKKERCFCCKNALNFDDFVKIKVVLEPEKRFQSPENTFLEFYCDTCYKKLKE